MAFEKLNDCFEISLRFIINPTNLSIPCFEGLSLPSPSNLRSRLSIFLLRLKYIIKLATGTIIIKAVKTYKYDSPPLYKISKGAPNHKIGFI